MKYAVGVLAIVFGIGLLGGSLYGWHRLRIAGTDPSLEAADHPLVEFMMNFAAPAPKPSILPPHPADLSDKIKFYLMAVGGTGLMLLVGGGVVCLRPRKE